MTIFRYGATGVLEIEANSEEEADDTLEAMTAEEALSHFSIDCFDMEESDDRKKGEDNFRRHMKAYEQWQEDCRQGKKASPAVVIPPNSRFYSPSRPHPWDDYLVASK